MDKMTDYLSRNCHAKAVTEVIVETYPRSFSEIAGEIHNRVKETFSGVISSRRLLPRLMEDVPTINLAPVRRIPRFNMVSAALMGDIIEDLAQRTGVKRIYSDMPVFALSLPKPALLTDSRGEEFTSTTWTKKQLGLDKASLEGFNGEGVGVGVIDTGARKTHEQLRNVYISTAIREKGGTGQDSNGHGTWVSSCIGGSYQTDRKYGAPVEGMATECRLYSIQALGFVVGMGLSSDTLQALDIAIAQGCKIVNLSIGGTFPLKDEDNPEAVAVQKLIDESIIPVAAAGNSGPAQGTISSPGSIENCITVGSLDLQGRISEYSSRGPTLDNYIKPDVVSYGDRVDSALVGFLDYQVDPFHQKYGIMSGTSMATPHVTGLLACMAQLYKQIGQNLTVKEVKSMMTALGESKTYDSGWGLITWPMVKEWVSSEHGYARFD